MLKSILILIFIWNEVFAKKYFSSLDYDELTEESHVYSGFTIGKCSALCLQFKCVYFEFEGKLLMYYGGLRA